MTEHGPPKKVEGRTPAPPGAQPSTSKFSGYHTTNQHQNSSGAGLQWCARRASSWRLPVLDSGRSDPWSCEPPGERGYPEAVEHLLEVGLLPAADREGLRVLYRRGGTSRQAAEFIAERWEIAA